MVIAGPSSFIGRYTNSLIIGFGSTFLSVILGTLAAYGFSRFRVPGKGDLMFFILSTRMMPPIAVAIPIYLMYRKLGLSDTQNCMTQPVIPRRSQGYSDVAGTWMHAPYLAMSQPFAAGALCSTVGDLARWDQALGNGQVVSQASYAQMTTPVGAAMKHKYGFGLMRDSLDGHVILSHGGGIPGFISANAWFPEDRMSVTVLTNSGSARADYLMAQVARAALGLPLQRVPTRVVITAAERAQYVGNYALNLGGTVRDFTFFERDGELYGQLAGQPANVLIPAGHDTFGASFDPSLRIIFTVENGKGTKMTLKQGGQSFDGPRKPNPSHSV